MFLPEERKYAHAHLLAFHNVLNCICDIFLFICISLRHSVCLFCISASEQKIGRASHAVCGRVCVCMCVCLSVGVCEYV